MARWLFEKHFTDMDTSKLDQNDLDFFDIEGEEKEVIFEQDEL